MAKKNGSKGKSGSKAQSHAYRGIRDIILNDTRGNVVSSITTNASGAGNISGMMMPLLLTSPQTGSGGTPATNDVVAYARCNWFASTAKNFQSYRITRAVLIWVGNVGSTSPGTINMFGSRDVMDATTGLQTAYIVGQDSKSFDLASSANKEQRLQMPVDPSWKKITSTLNRLGNDGFNGTQYSVVPVNSVNDLIAFSWYIQVVGGPASTNVGNAFIEYDVEFKGPISPVLNS